MRRIGWCFMAVIACMAAVCIATAQAQEGYVYVTSSPDGAQIHVDGKAKGPAPLLVTLTAGKHTIAAVLSGYATTQETIEVADREVSRLNLTLKQATAAETKTVQPLPKTGGKGNVTVLTDWAGAEIYLDGARVDQTTPVTLKDVSSGWHSLVLVKDGYAIYRRLMLRSGETLLVKESFDEFKKTRLESAARSELETQRVRQQELESKRQALPAKLILKMVKPATAATSTGKSSVLWGDSDTVTVAFQYRKPGEEQWTSQEIRWGATEEANFSLEKGTYEVQIVGTRYRTKNVFAVVVESRKEGEAKASFKKDFQADTQYVFTVTYDGKTELSYKIEESSLNTKVE